MRVVICGLLILLFIMLFTPAVVHAQGPTPTLTPIPSTCEQNYGGTVIGLACAEKTYSRDELLEAINAPVYHLTPMPEIQNQLSLALPGEKVGSGLKSMMAFFDDNPVLYQVVRFWLVGFVAWLIYKIRKIVMHVRDNW